MFAHVRLLTNPMNQQHHSALPTSIKTGDTPSPRSIAPNSTFIAWRWEHICYHFTLRICRERERTSGAVVLLIRTNPVWKFNGEKPFITMRLPRANALNSSSTSIRMGVATANTSSERNRKLLPCAYWRPCNSCKAEVGRVHGGGGRFQG